MSRQNAAMVVNNNMGDSEWVMNWPDNKDNAGESSNGRQADSLLKVTKMFARIEIDESRCKGCGLCTVACPIRLLKLNDETNAAGFNTAAVSSPDKCTGCALCAGICPDIAIKVYSRQLNIFTGMDLLDRLYLKIKAGLPVKSLLAKQ